MGTEDILRCTINGASCEFIGVTTVFEAFEYIRGSMNPTGKGVAIALDREIIPKSQWSSTRIPEGSALEIITAAPGG